MGQPLQLQGSTSVALSLRDYRGGRSGVGRSHQHSLTGKALQQETGGVKGAVNAQAVSPAPGRCEAGVHSMDFNCSNSNLCSGSKINHNVLQGHARVLHRT